MLGSHTDHFTGTKTPGEAYGALRKAQTGDRSSLWIGIAIATVALLALSLWPDHAGLLLAAAGLAALYAAVRLLDIANRDMLLHMLDLEVAQHDWQRAVDERARDLS